MIVVNDGPRIKSTDYWDSPPARAGKLFLSTNAGAFRLLVPPSTEALVDELRAVKAKGAAVSRGPWPDAQMLDAVEILLDDGSDDPFAMHLSAAATDRLPPDTELGRVVTLSVWRRNAAGEPDQVLSLACTFRRAQVLPDLRPWRDI